jgi:hypothetical protein
MAPAEGLFLYDVIYPPLNKIDLDIWFFNFIINKLIYDSL